jgi:hypothetical protein
MHVVEFGSKRIDLNMNQPTPSKPPKPTVADDLLNLNNEFKERFDYEFFFLLKQLTFSEIILRDDSRILKEKHNKFRFSLVNLFGCSFDGMCLSLSRIWQTGRVNDVTLISIPQLVQKFAPHKFLGALKLRDGYQDRATYERLIKDKRGKRLHVIRTEFFAHNVQLGKSTSRKNTDIEKIFGFNLVNQDVIDFCKESLELLFSIIDQLEMGKWSKGESLADMTKVYHDHHIAFLQCLDPSISLDVP